MNRIAIVFALFASSIASAQPAKAPAKKQPAPKKAPADPYADPKPSDPYAAPTPAPAPAPAPPASTGQPIEPWSPPARPATPAPDKGPKAKPGATTKAPLDPYAEPKPVPPTKGKPGKPGQPGQPTVGSGKPGKPVDPYAAPAPNAKPAIPARVGLADITAVQGLLAVQRLDGWLLFDRDGSNPISKRLVNPDGNPSRPWFYLIPARGQPTALVHDAENRSFEHLAGKKSTYKGYRELAKQLKVLLKGRKVVAVEYSPKAAVPNVSGPIIDCTVRPEAGMLGLG